MNKKILMVAGYYYPSIGGVQTLVTAIASRLMQSGYEITLVTSNSENVATFEKIEGLEIIRLPCFDILSRTYPIPRPSYLALKIIFNLLKRDYRLVITNTRFYPLCLIGLLHSRIKKIPLIHSEYGGQHSISEHYLVSMLGRMYDHSFGSLIVRSAGQNICISKKTEEFVRHLGAGKSTVIHSGIDISRYSLISGADPEPRPEAITITYLGRLIYSKGVQDLISVIPGIPGRIKLKIIGDGPYRAELERLARETDQDRIFFLGKKNAEEVIHILETTDIFVNPSYSEGLPTSVLEASAAGCAVVATNTGGTDEIIDDRENGYLVEPGDRDILAQRIGDLLDHPETRRSFGERIQAKISKEFSWDTIMVRWIEEIESFIRW